MPYRSIAALIAVGMLVPVVAAGQSATAEPPRTAWGDPDLGGVWDFRTITPLERPRDMGDKEFLTEEEAAAKEQEAVERDIRSNNAPARRAEAGDNVGAYNRFWMDFGTEVVETRRTSLIVDPPNGRRPPMTPQAREAASKRPRWGQEPPPDTYTDLSLFDRCIGTMALPIYPIAYNNNVQMFQTPNHVALWVEMMASTRIIPLDARPHGKLRQSLGDSRGHWEGDTLVVETTNFEHGLTLIGASRNARRLVERFTRVSPELIEYTFTIYDPATWTQPWTAVQTFRKATEPVFEYACHEGNYAIPNILAGARRGELAEKAGG